MGRKICETQGESSFVESFLKKVRKRFPLTIPKLTH